MRSVTERLRTLFAKRMRSVILHEVDRKLHEVGHIILDTGRKSNEVGNRTTESAACSANGVGHS